jgi:hypothetical protein
MQLHLLWLVLHQMHLHLHHLWFLKLLDGQLQDYNMAFDNPSGTLMGLSGIIFWLLMVMVNLVVWLMHLVIKIGNMPWILNFQH